MPAPALLLVAATSLTPLPPVVQAGITLPYGTMPGVQVGYRHALTPRAARASVAAVTLGADLSSVVDPGDFVRLGVAATAGMRWLRPSGFGLEVEGSLELSPQLQTLGQTVALGSGELTHEREWRLGLLPAATGRLSWRGHERLGVYAGLTLGPRIDLGRRVIAEYSANVGLRVNLGAMKEGGE